MIRVIGTIVECIRKPFTFGFVSGKNLYNNEHVAIKLVSSLKFETVTTFV